MGAIARQGPHHVAQKSTRTGVSDFRTSWSKFASVTSTIPLPAIFFLLVVTSRFRLTLHRSGAAGVGDLYESCPQGHRTLYRTTELRCTREGESRKPSTEECR